MVGDFLVVIFFLPTPKKKKWEKVLQDSYLKVPTLRYLDSFPHFFLITFFNKIFNDLVKKWCQKMTILRTDPGSVHNEKNTLLYYQAKKKRRKRKSTR